MAARQRAVRKPKHELTDEEQRLVDTKNDRAKLAEGFLHVKGVGRPKKNTPEKRGRRYTGYAGREEHVKFIIDCAAAYYRPSDIKLALQQKYGVDSPQDVTIGTIHKVIERLPNEVLERRKILMESAPVLNPAARMLYLQQIVDESIAGTPKLTKGGGIVMVKEFGHAISALKYVEAIQTKSGDGGIDVEELAAIKAQKDAINEYLEEKIKAGDKRSKIEILRAMTKEFQEHADVIAIMEEELSSELTQ